MKSLPYRDGRELLILICIGLFIYLFMWKCEVNITENQRIILVFFIIFKMQNGARCLNYLVG